MNVSDLPEGYDLVVTRPRSDVTSIARRFSDKST